MRRALVPSVLPSVLAVVLVACGGASTPSTEVGPLADQADRVADLLDDGRACEATEALRALQDMAATDAAGEVGDAVTAFATTAQGSLACDPAGSETSPTPDDGDDQHEDDGGKRKGKDKDKDKHKDEDKHEDEKDDGDD